jgi:hypothetical protein
MSTAAPKLEPTNTNNKVTKMLSVVMDMRMEALIIPDLMRPPRAPNLRI